MGMPFPHTHGFSAKIKLATISNSRSTYEIGRDSRCITWINSVYEKKIIKKEGILSHPRIKKNHKRGTTLFL